METADGRDHRNRQSIMKCSYINNPASASPASVSRAVTPRLSRGHGDRAIRMVSQTGHETISVY